MLHKKKENYLSLLANYGFECIGDVIIARENEVLTNHYEPIDVTNLASDLGENKAAEINAASRLSLAGTQKEAKSVPLGKYSRISPLVFSTVPFSQGWCGEQE